MEKIAPPFSQARRLGSKELSWNFLGLTSGKVSFQPMCPNSLLTGFLPPWKYEEALKSSVKDYYCPGITAGCHNYERTCCSFSLKVPIWWVNTRELQRKIYIPMGAISPIYNIYCGPDISVPSPHTQVSVISCYWKLRLWEVPSLHLFTPWGNLGSDRLF